jgi:hypothetical protein
MAPAVVTEAMHVNITLCIRGSQQARLSV